MVCGVGQTVKFLARVKNLSLYPLVRQKKRKTGCRTEILRRPHYLKTVQLRKEEGFHLFQTFLDFAGINAGICQADVVFTLPRLW